MHELGLTRNIVAIVSEHARGARVKRVALEGGVVPIVPAAVVFDLPVGGWKCRPTAEFGHAAAAQTVRGVLNQLDREEIVGELALREVREGRVEVVPMWGRPESVRREFARRRAQ